MIRKYDDAVLDFLKVDVWEKPIPIIFAGPRREYGNQIELGSETSFSSYMSNTVKLPAMSLQRTDWQLAMNRFTAAKARHLKYSDDLNMIAQAPVPAPYDIGYQLDIWAKYRADANALVEQVLVKFARPYISLEVDLGEAWGIRRVQLRNDGVSDNSELEVDGEQERNLRHTVSLVLEGWLPLPGKWVTTVRDTIVDVNIYKESGDYDAKGFTHSDINRDNPATPGE
jgi:hypothetical protein